VNLTIDATEFNLAMREYMKHTQRDVAEVLNQKAWSICNSASKMTRKADYNRMFLEIGPTAIAIVGQKIRVLKRGGIKRGKLITQKVFAAADNSAPRLALIINARLGKEGKSGLYGSAMRDAVEREWIRRARSIGFLRMGWLAPLFALSNAVGIKGKNPSRKAFERKSIEKRGWAIPARSGWRPEVSFWNTSGAERNNNPDVVKYVEQGLTSAIAQEIQRMGEHVAKKLQATANKYVSKLVRF
jgi:hypothetical protein